MSECLSPRTIPKLKSNDVRSDVRVLFAVASVQFRQRTVSPVFRVVRNDVRVLFRLLPV
jgi:hypothetical protein